MKKPALLSLVLAAAASSFAADERNVANRFELKDGSTLYIFKDGKMAMEDAKGRVMRMAQGKVMETKDGQRLVMVGNEVARLETIKLEHRGGGN